jgi:outer membrane protein W
LTAYYIFATGSGFRPYLGLALGLFLQNYSYEWTYTFSGGGGPMTQSGDESSSSFGIVPTAGFYYFIASTMMLQFAVEYNLLLGEIPTSGDSSSNTDIPKAASLSILLGLAFALGGGS